MIASLMPAVRIHCWGGFGSQLFAILQYWNLQKHFPDRKIVLIIHTSGITRRDMEIEPLLGDIPFKVMNDFAQRRESTTNLLKSSIRIRTIKTKLYSSTKNLIAKVGLLSELENQKAFDSLRPWVISVRGHYTRYPFKPADVLRLYGVMSIVDGERLNDKSENGVLTIQYRLGDLLNLTEKSFVDPELLLSIADPIAKKPNIIRTILLSDSPEEARHLLANNYRNWEVVNMSPIATIQTCVNSSEFIGTNSKISFWITVFRGLKSKESHIVDVFREKLNLISDKSTVSKFIYYQGGI